MAAVPAGFGPAAWASASAVREIALTVCSSVGGGFTSGGLSAASRSIAASPSSASFASCCSGMKLASVIARLTSGSAERRLASAAASPSVGARISIVLGVESGSFMRSTNVATDSAFGLRRCSGLKSNSSFGSSTMLPTAINAAPDEDREAPPDQESIERCQGRITDFATFAAGTHHREQRRQHGDAGHERDDHARSSDQAEFRHAAVVGRQE